MPKELSTEAGKLPAQISGEEKVPLFDPAESDKFSAADLRSIIEWAVNSGLISAPLLQDLTVRMQPVSTGMTAGTDVGNVSGYNPQSSLSVSGISVDLNEYDVMTNEDFFSLAGLQNGLLTETYGKSANSPKASPFAIDVRYPGAVSAVAPYGELDLGDFWRIDWHPEFIAFGYFQEDLPFGDVSAHPARGITGFDATLSTPIAPVREVGGGVVFAAGLDQRLTVPFVRDDTALIRWHLAIVRADQPTSRTDVVSINGDSGTSTHRHPALRIDGANGWLATWNGRVNGSSTGNNIAIGGTLDNKTWNVVLTYRRGGRLFASIDGQDVEYSSPFDYMPSRAENGPDGVIGHPQSVDINWAYDALVFGHSELTETQVHKIEGWAMWRIGRQAELPDGHPYKMARPVVDAEDFPARYEHDATTWATFQTERDAIVTSNQGGARVAPVGYERVFLEDFRADRVTDSDQQADTVASIWYAPGWNRGIGKDAANEPPRNAPECYVFNGDGTYTLNLHHNGSKWRAGTIMSVNDAGQGRSWQGPFVARVRCRFPNVPDPIPTGYFHCPLWFYSTLSLMWRSEERIEIDVVEPEGTDRDYCGGLSIHVHEGEFPGKFGNVDNGDVDSVKVWGGSMDEAATGVPGGYDHWDGEWHTWEIHVDMDFTYVNVTVDKGAGEEWIELFRCPTPKELLVRKYVISDVALRSGTPAADTSITHGMDLDFFEILQKTSQVESAPSPFSARPTLSGAAQVGATLTCTPNVSGISDVWYYWYVGDYPKNYGPGATYTIVPEDEGETVRCMVQATGALNQPEAWTERTAVVSA